MANTPILLGSTGIVRYGGASGRIEDEWHPNLRGQLAAKVYRQMRDNDAIVGSALHLMTTTLRQVEWTVRPADNSPEAADAAEFLESCLEDLDHTWADFLSEALSMIWFGWSLFEKGYKQRLGKNSKRRFSSKHDDGRIGWSGFYARSQESLANDGWGWDDEGNFTGMWQQLVWPYRKVFIPIDRCILFRTEANKGNPEGRSWLRNYYRSWWFKTRLEEIEAITTEREGAGLVIVELPEPLTKKGATADQKAARASYDKLAMQIRRGAHEGVTFPSEFLPNGKPSGYKIRLLTSGGQRAIDIGSAIRRYDRNGAMVFATQFQLLGQENSGGSRALSSDHTDMFGVTMGTILSIIRDMLQHQAVDELMELNGIPVEKRPWLQHGDIEKRELDKLATMLKTLVDGGLIEPDRELENYLRDTIQLPSKDETEMDDEEDFDTPSPDDALDDLGIDDVELSKSSLIPSEAMAENARLALRVRDRLPREKRAMGVINLAAARSIARQDSLRPTTMKRMVAYFAKHAGKMGPSWEKGGRNWQVWNGLGGDASVQWIAEEKKARTKDKVGTQKTEVCPECGTLFLEPHPGDPCPECGVEMRLRTADLPVPPVHEGR